MYIYVYVYIYIYGWRWMDGPHITVEHASSLVNIFGLLFERNACIVAIIVVSDPFSILI